jgi:hypothetical protein
MDDEALARDLLFDPTTRCLAEVVLPARAEITIATPATSAAAVIGERARPTAQCLRVGASLIVGLHQFGLAEPQVTRRQFDGHMPVLDGHE